MTSWETLDRYLILSSDAHAGAPMAAYKAYLESGAEAVICISNKAATLKMVSELQQRGIPAFGPIWDS